MPGFYDLTKSEYFKHYDTNALTTRSIAYYSRYLLQKAQSVFKWTVPENWDLNYLLFCLYTIGFVCVTDIPKYGVVPQRCTIQGYNIYYNPARALISNPQIDTSITVDLGENGELLALAPDYSGIMDCVQEYAEMLANASCAVNTNLYNSRLSYVFYAKNKSQANSYKKMYDEIGTGQPAVFIDSKLVEESASGERIQPFEPFNANLKENYIATDILEDMRRIEHEFAQKIGLPNTNTEKRERMTEDEISKTDVESVSNVVVWYDMIQTCIKRIKTLYPDISLSCEYRFPNTVNAIKEGVKDDDNETPENLQD